MSMIENFRGAKMVFMITVKEGEGTPESPAREVHYVYDPNKMYLGGTHGACVGKIDNWEQSANQKTA